MYRCHRPGFAGGGCWLYITRCNPAMSQAELFHRLGSPGKKVNRWGKLEISWRQAERKAQGSAPEQPGSVCIPAPGTGDCSQVSPGPAFTTAHWWLFWALGIRRKRTRVREGRNREEESRREDEMKEKRMLKGGEGGQRVAPNQTENIKF